MNYVYLVCSNPMKDTTKHSTLAGDSANENYYSTPYGKETVKLLVCITSVPPAIPYKCTNKVIGCQVTINKITFQNIYWYFTLGKK